MEVRIDQERTGVSDERVHELAEQLADYREYLRTAVDTGRLDVPEASLLLPDGADAIGETHTTRVTDLVDERLRYIIVIGIGGSNLGTKAVYEALVGTDDCATQRYPKVLFAETTDTRHLETIATSIDQAISAPEELLVAVVSKSGGTTETIVNAEVLLGHFRRRFGTAIMQRTVAITDPNSPLREAASAHGMSVRTLPPSVGGRYSVFSAVGLVPLAAAGVDTCKLRDGARAMREQCLADDENPAVQSAAVQFSLFHRGDIQISDTFLFGPALESLGKWYRQLMGESLGKEEDETGSVVRTGIVPTVSIGSIDLHSVGQLYLGGPRTLFTTFVGVVQDGGHTAVPHDRLFPSLTPEVSETSAASVLDAIYEGTTRTYHDQGLPYAEAILNAYTPEEIGAFMQWKMCEMMYLGALMNVNAFNQPHVELYKRETKRILAS